MQTIKSVSSLKKQKSSLFFIFTSLALLAVVDLGVACTETKIERVRIIKDKSGEDLFATFNKMQSQSEQKAKVVKGSGYAKQVSYVGGDHVEDELTHFLNMDKEDTPKLILENLGAMKVGVNVASKQKKGFVYSGSKKISWNKKPVKKEKANVLTEAIRSWLGKELFKDLKKKASLRSQSVQDSGSRAGKKSGIEAMAKILNEKVQNQKIVIDSSPKAKETNKSGSPGGIKWSKNKVGFVREE